MKMATKLGMAPSLAAPSARRAARTEWIPMLDQDDSASEPRRLTALESLPPEETLKFAPVPNGAAGLPTGTVSTFNNTRLAHFTHW